MYFLTVLMVNWFSVIGFQQFVQMFSSFTAGTHSGMLDGGYDHLQLDGGCLQSHKMHLWIFEHKSWLDFYVVLV